MTFSIPFMDSFAQAANEKGGDVDRGPLPRSLPSRELSPKRRGRQVNKTHHPRYCQWQTWCRLHHYKAILHTSSHLILTLVSGPEGNVSNLPKVSQLWCNRTNYRNLTDTIVRAVRRDSEFTGVPGTIMPMRGTGTVLGALPTPTPAPKTSPTLVPSRAQKANTWLLLAPWMKLG